ncbi:CPA2 family monovalent cation:H+ antiporter-2 [Sphingobium sp. B11D3B]|uniref:cation:proton antiporter domain-containing protein n=1 Tax=Sphingobium sp. B11D3B TaxID=2940575 RepID=UPI0022273D8B|nr:cation:proton antiporter [Sphingobium sp. B11D3B]MCW2388222.1 CPA2 family monovalent cation:H+ antiporter-2 [Sphingobium sp. B11D3B]
MIHGTFGSQTFNEALVILGAAGLVIPAFARFRISPIIGFILVGLLVGPFGLGRFVSAYPALAHVTISRESAITAFAELGIVMLLFSIGLELSFKRLWSMRKFVFGIGAAELLGSATLIGGGMLLLGSSLYAAIGLGLALSLSSTALVMPIAGTHSAVGKSAFGMLLFEDLALVPIVFALGAMAPNVADDGWENLATVLLTGGLAVLALLIGGRFMLPRLFAQAARAKRPEVFLAASLLVVMVSSLLTTAAGLSPIVGALVAGILIAETDYHGQVEGMTEPFKGLALGVFLITVGMAIDPVALVAQWDGLLLAITGVVLAKVAVTSLLLRLAGARRGVALETGILMGSPSETTLIVLASAVTANLISPGTAAFWQMATAIGLTLTPILAKFGHRMARRVERDALEPDSTDTDDDARAAIILGFGRVGRTVADLLRVHEVPYVAVENDIDIVAQARAEGYTVQFGDVSRPDTLDRLRLGRAQALIITMDDPVLAMRVTNRVRGWLDDLPIIVRARDTTHAAQLYRAGASDAVPETLESSLHLAETALVDLGLPMGPVIASVHQKREDLQNEIKAAAELDVAPRLRSRRLGEANGPA